ncbi:lysine biosynthesis protein LysW [Candidatus Parcubacteria bacterium]|nr:lysine biosynthesis protein LysW [Candidatus Parcubacteria bacterium]
MTTCQECNCEISIDEKTIKIGDVVVCSACGAEHEIISIDPLELELIEEEK